MTATPRVNHVLLLEPKAFGECFLALIREVRKKAAKDILSQDGPPVQACTAEDQPPLHGVSGWFGAQPPEAVAAGTGRPKQRDETHCVCSAFERTQRIRGATA